MVIASSILVHQFLKGIRRTFIMQFRKSGGKMKRTSLTIDIIWFNEARDVVEDGIINSSEYYFIIYYVTHTRYYPFFRPK